MHGVLNMQSESTYSIASGSFCDIRWALIFAICCCMYPAHFWYFGQKCVSHSFGMKFGFSIPSSSTSSMLWKPVQYFSIDFVQYFSHGMSRSYDFM